jgi:putative intracellular protease/amidase
MRVAILLFDEVTALDAIGPYEVLSRVFDSGSPRTASAETVATVAAAFRQDR